MRIDFEKKPLSFCDQAKLLKTRGLDIGQLEDACSLLKRINYYRLRGYYIHIYDSDNEVFTEDASLYQICQIHDFDMELMHLTANALMVLETALKTQVAYCHAKNYGGLGYKHFSNFSVGFDHQSFIEEIDNSINSSRDVFTKHYITKYNKTFPIWVIVELLSMGCISKLFYSLHETDKQSITQYFGIKNISAFRSNIKCLTVLRNICAHGGRIYGRKLPFKVNLNRKDKTYSSFRNSYFSYLLALKQIIGSEKVWCNFVTRLDVLIDEYKIYITLSMLDMPCNWKQILLN